MIIIMIANDAARAAMWRRNGRFVSFLFGYIARARTAVMSERAHENFRNA